MGPDARCGHLEIASLSRWSPIHPIPRSRDLIPLFPCRGDSGGISGLRRLPRSHDVRPIDEYVDETPHRSMLVEDAVLDPWDLRPDLGDRGEVAFRAIELDCHPGAILRPSSQVNRSRQLSDPDDAPAFLSVPRAMERLFCHASRLERFHCQRKGHLGLRPPKMRHAGSVGGRRQRSGSR
jgi:hypothetical protein